MKKIVVIGALAAGALGFTGLAGAAYATDGSAPKGSTHLECSLDNPLKPGKNTEQGLNSETRERSGPSTTETGKPGTGPKLTIGRDAKGTVTVHGAKRGQVHCTAGEAPAK